MLRPLTSRNVLLVAGIAALLYYFLEVYLFNRELINQTLSEAYSLTYKTSILGQLTLGYLAMFPLTQMLFILLTTLLVGLNIALLIALLQTMQQGGRMKVSFGGASLLAVVSTGCPSCGLTVLSFLGPSGGVVAGMFHSPLAQLIMIVLLGASIGYSLVRLEKSRVCRI